MNDSPEWIPQILSEARTIAVVGLSSTPWRTSNSVSEYMQQAGYRIVPVNPNETEVLGEKAYATLEEAAGAIGAQGIKIDIVDIFRRSEFVRPVVESAIRIGAKAIWMQEGVEDEEAAQLARAAGLNVVMNRCIMKDHVLWASSQGRG